MEHVTRVLIADQKTDSAILEYDIISVYIRLNKR